MTLRSEILADSPYVYWPQDDRNSSQSSDASGNGRSGTYNGKPVQGKGSLVPFQGGWSVDYPTSSDYLLSNFIFNSSLATVEVWFDYDGTASNSTFVAGCDQGAGTYDKVILLNAAGVALFLVFDGAQKIAVGTTVLTPGRHYLVGTYDGT